MDSQTLANLHQLLDHESDLREKIRDQVNDFDKKTRILVGILSKIHSTRSESTRPVLYSCSETIVELASLIPPNQFWRWKDMWCNSLRTAVFAAALSEYLTNGTLISLESTSNVLGMQDRWKDRVNLSVEDYLHGLITMVNELSRLAVNAVILGDFEQPLKISAFVKDIFSGFSMLNLKNDTLRRRFDSLKYDMKKIEEGRLASDIFMSRRQGMPLRPASSEEIECWNHAAASLSTLSAIYSGPATIETIGRVNRLISAWPADDTLPAEGLDSVKAIYKKLVSGLEEIRLTSEKENKAIDNAMEQLGILIALRKAPEIISQEKRNKRPRAASPSAGGTPVPQVLPAPGGINRVSITLPARNSSTGPPAGTALPREPKARREAWAKQLPLQEGRQVAFHPPPNKGNSSVTESDDNNWILAVVDKCINGDKNRYEVHDPESVPISRFNTTLRSIIPLPDPNAPAGSPSSLSAYREFPIGSTVLALYPDTSCFYRAEVVATPTDTAPSVRSDTPYASTYRVKFEDDDNQELVVQAQWVVEWPGGQR